MKNLPKRREIDSALTRRFTCVSATGAQCVRACLGCACGGRPGSTNSRRNARVYHAATAGDGARTTTRSVADSDDGRTSPPRRGRRTRRCNKSRFVSWFARTLARSLVRRSSLILPQQARRARTTTAATRQ